MVGLFYLLNAKRCKGQTTRSQARGKSSFGKMSLESILKATGKNIATQVVSPELIKDLITISQVE